MSQLSQFRPRQQVNLAMPLHKPLSYLGYRFLPLMVVLLLLGGCALNTGRPFDGPGAEAEITSLLHQTVRGHDGEINRHVLLLIDAPSVNFSYRGAAGIARADTLEPITPEWQFYIASVAKSMTAAVVHQLAEEGAFGSSGIDTTLAELQVLPPQVLADLHRIEGVSHAHQITLRHLLKHTSGLRDLAFDGMDTPVSLLPGTADGASLDSLVGMAVFDEQYGLTPLVKCTLEGVPAGCNPDDYLLRYPWVTWDYSAWQADPRDRMAGLLNFFLAGFNEHALWEPGTGFHYSETNYLLLVMAIEHVTGHSFTQELYTRILEPLEMDDTYLVGQLESSTQPYTDRTADVWAWGEPTISGGVMYTFERGGGGIVSSVDDLQKFVRALAAGELFHEAHTLDEMLAVPENVKGISYASGLIVFPTDQGPVLYMMGSNGTWVEYFPPLDLVMIGTIDDFGNPPTQFQLYLKLWHTLARHGLPTPMARLTSLPSLLAVGSGVLLFVPVLAVLGTWFFGAFRRKSTATAPEVPVKLAHWLTLALFFVHLGMLVWIGFAFSANIFQMLFGFSPQVRGIFAVTAILMGGFALILLAVTVQLWRRDESELRERSLFTAIAILTLVYAVATSAVGL